MKRGGGLLPARPDCWPPTKQPRATPGGLIAASVTCLSRREGVTRSRGGPATGRCGGHTQVSRQAKHYAHKGINALSCDKAFQNPCHSAKRERKYVQQHIGICTHGVKTGLG